MPDYSDYRLQVNSLFQAALKAANPAEALRRHWDADALNGAERVFVVGAGKAGVAMGETAATLLGSRLTAAILAVPQLPTTNNQSHSVSLRGLSLPITFIPAGHPHPTAGSLAAGEAIARLLTDTTEHDLVIALISGGGSALLDYLNPGLNLEDLQRITNALLRSGVPIQDLNCVRKHLSQIKGGGLARLAYPAKLVAYILSDVIGDPLDVIASGPTVPDPTTVEEALTILKQIDLPDFRAVRDLTGLNETPKPANPIFARVTNHLIGSNQLAREAAAEAAARLGFQVHLPEEVVQGEARDWWFKARHFIEGATGPQAWISGGETTVTVKGQGQGGRNQELVLSAAIALEGDARQLVIASMGTDGVDGFSPAAGALATPQTCARARSLGLNPAAMLADNDSYSFFNALGDSIVTGPTGTNVNDVVVVLLY
jgi:hydroxypyruvate reductase